MSLYTENMMYPVTFVYFLVHNSLYTVQRLRYKAEHIFRYYNGVLCYPLDKSYQSGILKKKNKSGGFRELIIIPPTSGAMTRISCECILLSVCPQVCFVMCRKGAEAGHSLSGNVHQQKVVCLIV